MGITKDHRRYAEECMAMAQLSYDEKDKALWLTLAQSWVRLADHVTRGQAYLQDGAVDPSETVSAGGE
jgi:hypothetical protein